MNIDDKLPDHPDVPNKNPDAHRKKKVPGYDEKNPTQPYPDNKKKGE